jgi:hypothetical protein
MYRPTDDIFTYLRMVGGHGSFHLSTAFFFFVVCTASLLRADYYFDNLTESVS